MAAEHLSGYFGGTISFEETRAQEVVSALNLLVSRKAKLVVGRSTVEGGIATLPFGLKETSSSGLISAIEEGVTVDDLKRVLNGCDIKCYPLKPSVSNSKHLELAKELEALVEAEPFSIADIAAPHAEHRNDAHSPKHADFAEEPDPFSGLIGLNDQIRTFRELATTVQEYGREALESLNVILTGDPGVGKSSVAQAFARYAQSEGLVTGPFRQISAESLIARYAGQTPSLVKAQWTRARGGIFLLDEAYRLSQDTGGYGREALNTLNELMERDRDTLVICAGYRKEMAEFLNQNPGLAQRFAFHIDFPSYDDYALEQIFLNFATAKGFDFTEKAADMLPEAMSLIKRDPHFANGRSVRNLFDKCVIKQACYCNGGKTISKKALSLALADMRPSSPICASRIGFIG